MPRKTETCPQVQDFLSGIFGGNVRRHRINPNGIRPFTLCDGGGWCTENPEEVSCPDCKAIQEGRAERLALIGGFEGYPGVGGSWLGLRPLPHAGGA